MMYKECTVISNNMTLISKRLRYMISSFILLLGFVSIQFVDERLKFFAIGTLVILTGILSIWSFYEGLGKNMTLVSLILPMLYTLGVGIFWFLIPASLYTRIPIIFFYTFGVYILFSTMNIYTVSSSKTIALLRAARGVGFVLTLVVSFLLFDAVLSIRQNILISSSLVFTISFLLFLQGFWSIELEKKIDSIIITLSLAFSLIVAELAMVMFFWPVTVVVGSLFLTSGVYMLLGLGQTKLEDRLFPGAVREYLTVGLVVFIGMFFATHWG